MFFPKVHIITSKSILLCGFENMLVLCWTFIKFRIHSWVWLYSMGLWLYSMFTSFFYFIFKSFFQSSFSHLLWHWHISPDQSWHIVLHRTDLEKVKEEWRKLETLHFNLQISPTDRYMIFCKKYWVFIPKISKFLLYS